MADLDKKQAREFVDDIRINNGGVTDEDRETASASILRSVASLRTALAATTQMYFPLTLHLYVQMDSHVAR